MSTRGLLSAINRAAKAAEREQRRRQREADRSYKAAVREAERTRREDERAQKQLASARAAERKRLEKEAKQAHIAAMEAEVESLNLELAEMYDEIDSLLAETLEVDDFVDLEELRTEVRHPPFDRPELENPIPRPEAPEYPPRPQPVVPEKPSGLSALVDFGRHDKAVAAAKGAYERAMAAWREKKEEINRAFEDRLKAHRKQEVDREKALEVARAEYTRECEQRDADATRSNAELDKLIAELGYGVPEAVEEYISIVLSNSIYPECFPTSYEHSFSPEKAELSLRVEIPAPSEVPSVKHYKYIKAKDEIREVSLPKTATKKRYAAAVHQVALRTIHEVFEADRRGLIRTVSLVVGTDTIIPATGNQEFIPFVAVGAERDSFLEFDLSAVVPLATLEHLGGAVSKNPVELVAVDVAGIRGGE